MKNTRLAKRLSVIAATAALTGIAAMPSASAAQQWAWYDQTQAQVDTAPNNGAPSWVWGYVADNGNISLVRGSVDYMYADGSVNSVWIGKGQSLAINTSQRVIGIRACEEKRSWDGTYSQFWWECGDWSWV
ncbi:hypothetical protein [Streptomyces sp. NPDC002265]|uniref:hypothetical protein n=1 Tax=Streptomyces sp. NPDC002265 TaxID=3154415 RepID=UPI0033286D27